jgi:hypothetical protein
MNLSLPTSDISNDQNSLMARNSPNLNLTQVPRHFLGNIGQDK